MADTGRIRGQYERMTGDRDEFLQRGRLAARITIPYLLPETTSLRGNHGDLPMPYQGIGAAGVNNLTNKMVIGLVPVNQSFVRMKLEPSAEAVVRATDPSGQLMEGIDAQLAEVEAQIMDAMDTWRVRPKIHQAIQQCIVTGNALLHMPSNRPPRVFRLDSYVCQRDPRGHVVKIITRELVEYTELPEDVREAVPDKKRPFGAGVPGYSTDDQWCEVYTCIQREEYGSAKNRQYEWVEQQEVDGVLVRDPTEWPMDRFPYLPLRFHPLDGESYGRGHVEQYMGSLRTLEGLVASMFDCASAAGRLLCLVNEELGRTRIANIKDAPNGAMIPGHKDDITFMQVEKFADMRIISEEINRLERQLNHAFLITVPRDAERVTAEEIRLIQQQLNDTLGGTYASFAEELQIPLVRNLIGRLREAKVLPDLKRTRPVIVTGLEALGRGHELDRLDRFLIGAQQVIGPDATAQYLNVGAYLEARRKASGVDIPNLVKSEQQMAEEARAAQLRSGMEKLGPKFIDKMPQEALQAAAASLTG